ncbi:hypothetical protein [Nonomuraea longicatena]|uniref:hypothetical protein n=1 Tax=Nonomuraea longicatena TaxID=83682 RepID=UPI0031D7C1AC
MKQLTDALKQPDSNGWVRQAASRLRPRTWVYEFGLVTSVAAVDVTRHPIVGASICSVEVLPFEPGSVQRVERGAAEVGDSFEVGDSIH